MTVGFYHQGTSAIHCAVAEKMVASVHRTMPGIAIVHFSDPRTPAIADVDDHRTLSAGPIALAVLQAYAAAGAGDWLFLDTDVIVQHDVSHVFDQAFDLAVATREGTLRPNEIGRKFMTAMPYNKGAVFSRCPTFWLHAVTELSQWPAKAQHWMGDQRVFCELIRRGEYRVHVLENGYNYPPFTRDEDVRDKAILHFKGPRKAWMLEAA